MSGFPMPPGRMVRPATLDSIAELLEDLVVQVWDLDKRLETIEQRLDSMEAAE